MTQTPAADIVERLRATRTEADGPHGIFEVLRNPDGPEAATEIEALRAHEDEHQLKLAEAVAHKAFAEARSRDLQHKLDEVVKALEPFALASTEGVVKHTESYARVVMVADYFHGAARTLASIRGETD